MHQIAGPDPYKEDNEKGIAKNYRLLAVGLLA